jgi:hypothetical protein
MQQCHTVTGAQWTQQLTAAEAPQAPEAPSGKQSSPSMIGLVPLATCVISAHSIKLPLNAARRGHIIV